MQERRSSTLWLLGGVAGFVNGFLGTGGGLILVLGLTRLIPEQDLRDRLASAALTSLLFSAVSAVIYLTGGCLPTAHLPAVLPSAAAGGAIGALLLDRLPAGFLKALFACLAVIAGALLLFL